jgi:O-antigen/teichoic acid export membrane protein
MLRLSRDLIALVVAWSMLAGGDILLLPIVSRILTPAEYGTYALAFGLSVFLADASSLWVTSSLVRFFPEEADDAARLRLRRNLWWAGVGTSFIVAIVMCAIGFGVGYFWNVPHSTLLLATGLVPLLCVFSYTLADFQAQSKMLSYAALAIVRFFISTLVGISLILWTDTGANGLLLGLAVSLLLLSVVSIYQIRPGVLPSIDQSVRELLRAAMGFGFGVWLQNLGAKILRIGDRYFIAIFVSTAAAGAYSALYAVIAGLSTLIATPVLTMVTPKIYKIYENKGEHETAKWLNRTNLSIAVALGVMSVGFLAAFPAIRRFVLTDTYGDALPYWAIASLLIACSVQAQSLVIGISFSLVKRTGTLARIFLISAAVNVAGNLILIPLIGARGAALMTLVAYICLLSLTAIRATPLIDIRISWGVLICTSSSIAFMILADRLGAGWLTIVVISIFACAGIGLSAMRPVLNRRLLRVAPQ